jgi:hypothetical protein
MKTIELSFLVIALAACSPAKGDVKPAPIADTSARPPKGPREIGDGPYRVAEKSTTSVDMPAPKEHIKAKTTGALGTVQFDPRDVRATRGQVKIDLTTLTTSTFDDAENNKAQTRHARMWLEATVGDEINEEHRWATFDITSADEATDDDVTRVVPVREGELDVRAVMMTVHGLFMVHGRRVNKDVRVELRCKWPAGVGGRPHVIDVRTVRPFPAVLAEHEVKPRDEFGKVAKSAFNLLGTKVADVADVSVDLRLEGPSSKIAAAPM